MIYSVGLDEVCGCALGCGLGGGRAYGDGTGFGDNTSSFGLLSVSGYGCGIGEGFVSRLGTCCYGGEEDGSGDEKGTGFG